MQKTRSVRFDIVKASNIIPAIQGRVKYLMEKGHDVGSITLNTKFYQALTKRLDYPPVVRLCLNTYKDNGVQDVEIREDKKQKCDGKLFYSVEVKEIDCNLLWRACCDKARPKISYIREGDERKFVLSTGPGMRMEITNCPYCGKKLVDRLIL